MPGPLSASELIAKRQAVAIYVDTLIRTEEVERGLRRVIRPALGPAGSLQAPYENARTLSVEGNTLTTVAQRDAALAAAFPSTSTPTNYYSANAAMNNGQSPYNGPAALPSLLYTVPLNITSPSNGLLAIDPLGILYAACYDTLQSIRQIGGTILWTFVVT